MPALPRRATLAPVVTTSWRDEKVEFGAVRCYVVRTVVTLGTPVESEPSPVACLSPTDTFPPKAPTSLAAVASEGAINLIWDANTEADLAGYIVLRGSASGATMRPLMTAPIKETTFRDTTVRASAPVRVRGRRRRHGDAAERLVAVESGGGDGAVKLPM